MKKKNIYLASFVLSLGINLHAQDAFWTPTTYKGAFPVTDNTAASDWTSGWSNFDAENTDYPATTTTVSTDITTSTTWSGVILLQNKIYVRNSATLTIAPGTIIRGDKLTQGTLIITRGAKILADGTATNPIIFTSNEAVGARNEGDWGGLVLLGLAKNNQPGGVANIEGIVPTTDSQFGGNFDNDYSGILRYVRIEFAGIALEPNKEINGVTFGSVGNQTIVDYVQVSFSGDDSFEWFGGTVNCKHLIAYRGIDDDFDTDFGYRGKVQFGLSIRDNTRYDAPGDSNCFESDNDATGSANLPQTAAIFSNFTIVGPLGNGSQALPIGEKFEKAFRIRRNSSLKIYNSIFMDGSRGIHIDGTACEANATAGTSLTVVNNALKFKNNLVAGYLPTKSVEVNSGSSFNIINWFGLNANDSLASSSNILVNPYGTNFLNPDLRPITGSNALSNMSFVDLGLNSMLIGAPSAQALIRRCQAGTTVTIGEIKVLEPGGGTRKLDQNITFILQ